MRAWRIAKKQFAHDLQGTGSSLYGGRWNNQGVGLIYTGLSLEICALEVLVHASNIVVPDLVVVEYTLPNSPQLYLSPAIENLPGGWDDQPSSPQAAAYGDEFVAKNEHLGLIVPSAIIPEARNLLINPRHPAIQGVQLKIVRAFTFDQRLAGK